MCEDVPQRQPYLNISCLTLIGRRLSEYTKLNV